MHDPMPEAKRHSNGASSRTPRITSPLANGSAHPAPALAIRYKRPFDLAVIAVGVLALLPFWAVVWTLIPIAIWLEDRRPIFYKQERLGRFGKRFWLFKFRTMVVDAEAGTGAVLATKEDARITAVGRVLRRFHLDELPQIINIVRGDMSLVGPRPERPELAEAFASDLPHFADRLAVRPGIAGLAQACGRKGYWTPPREKLRYDKLYLSQMGPGTDLKLLFLSFWVAFRRALNERYALNSKQVQSNGGPPH